MRILLVEDDIDLVDLTVDAFEERIPSVQIVGAPDGPGALEKLGEISFDMIILDYTLPGMNGVEVLKKIKALGCAAPVIMVSGQRNDAIIAEAMAAGAQEYMFKTTTYHDELADRVEKMIQDDTFRGPFGAGPEKAI